MALIFNSITQFVQQPERTKRRVKRDDLDTVTEVWVGPTVLEDGFVPRIGAKHPEANLMTVLDTSIKRMPASVSEVTINYQGKLDSYGSDSYTSVPTISQSWMEGEVSYQVNGSTSISVSGLGPGAYVIQSGVATYSHRYTGRCAQIVYITNRRPSGNPTQLGLSKDFLGFTNEWDTLSGFQGGAQVNGGGPPIKQMTCTDVAIEDRADGWYRVTETYQSRMFPKTAVSAGGGGSFSFGNIAVNTQQPSSQNTGAVTEANLSAQGAAVSAALKAGQPLVGSTDPNAVDTAQATGINPGWVDVSQVAPAVAGAISSGNLVDLGGGSYALDY
jgi:hypothetical protein